jgi:hypothetical protein
MNSASLQEVRQDKPRGSGSHNPNLCADAHRFFRRDLCCGNLC